MDDKMRIAIVVIVIFVLAIPILGKLAKESSSGEEAATTDAPAAKKAEPVLEPPLLNAANIVNTKWQVSISGISVTVTFLANGQAIGESPMLKLYTGESQLPVSWTIEGADLTLTASAKGKTQSGKCKISGNNILVEGKPATRLQ